MSLHLIPYNQNGKIQVDFRDAQVAIENYDANFEGKSDISKAFNVVLKNFKSFFKNEVANIMARKISKTFEETFNAMLYQGPSILNVMDGLIYMNYTLTGDPIFNEDYMAVPFDGTFLHTIDEEIDYSQSIEPMPSYYDQGKQC